MQFRHWILLNNLDMGWKNLEQRPVPLNFDEKLPISAIRTGYLHCLSSLDLMGKTCYVAAQKYT